MWVYGTITVYDKDNNVIHKFSAKTLVECETEDPYEAMDKAIELWSEMFKSFGTYVEVDDIYA